MLKVNLATFIDIYCFAPLSTRPVQLGLGPYNIRHSAGPALGGNNSGISVPFIYHFVFVRPPNAGTSRFYARRVTPQTSTSVSL